MKNKFKYYLFYTALISVSQLSFAESDSDLAQKLTNPVADLISVPFQGNYNTHLNPISSGHQYYVNFQPVIPISISENWNLISRTIVPIIDQTNGVPFTGTRFGLSDTLQSLFFSPKKPTESGIIWGLGPAIQIPTGTQTLLGTGKWAIGPTAVVLKMSKGWTYGILANHLWSFAGNEERASLNQTYMQPFLSYTTKTAWTYSLNSESTYYWNSDDLSMPFNLQISKLIKIGHLPVSIGGGPRYFAVDSDNGPRNWGARAVVTLLFPTDDSKASKK